MRSLTRKQRKARRLKGTATAGITEYGRSKYGSTASHAYAVRSLSISPRVSANRSNAHARSVRGE